MFHNKVYLGDIPARHFYVMQHRGRRAKSTLLSQPVTEHCPKPVSLSSVMSGICQGCYWTSNFISHCYDLARKQTLGLAHSMLMLYPLAVGLNVTWQKLIVYALWSSSMYVCRCVYSWKWITTLNIHQRTCNCIILGKYMEIYFLFSPSSSFPYPSLSLSLSLSYLSTLKHTHTLLNVWIIHKCTSTHTHAYTHIHTHTHTHMNTSHCTFGNFAYICPHIDTHTWGHTHTHTLSRSYPKQWFSEGKCSGFWTHKTLHVIQRH